MPSPDLPTDADIGQRLKAAENRTRMALLAAGLAMAMAIVTGLVALSAEAIAQATRTLRGQTVLLEDGVRNRAVLSADGDATRLIMVSPDGATVFEVNVSDSGVKLDASNDGRISVSMTAAEDVAVMTFGDGAVGDLVGIYANEGRGLVRVQDSRSGGSVSMAVPPDSP